MARQGVPTQVTEKTLHGHISGAVRVVAAVYNRYSNFDEMREARERYDEIFAKLITNQQAGILGAVMLFWSCQISDTPQGKAR